MNKWLKWINDMNYTGFKENEWINKINRWVNEWLK